MDAVHLREMSYYTSPLAIGIVTPGSVMLGYVQLKFL